jgi:hypothetical protein
VYPDGSRYDGNFHAGKRDGRGSYTFPGGQQLSGKWSADYIDENGAWLLGRAGDTPVTVQRRWLFARPRARHQRLANQPSHHRRPRASPPASLPCIVLPLLQRARC